VGGVQEAVEKLKTQGNSRGGCLECKTTSTKFPEKLIEYQQQRKEFPRLSCDSIDLILEYLIEKKGDSGKLDLITSEVRRMFFKNDGLPFLRYTVS
jgi:hypothetical protein